jgi:hypothetical protein
MKNMLSYDELKNRKGKFVGVRLCKKKPMIRHVVQFIIGLANRSSSRI